MYKILIEVDSIWGDSISQLPVREFQLWNSFVLYVKYLLCVVKSGQENENEK